MLIFDNIKLSLEGAVPTVTFKDKMDRDLTSSQVMYKILRRIYSYIQDIELFILKIVGLIPIYSIRYLFYLTAGIKIGRRSYIHMGAQFFEPSNITIGEGTIIGQGAFLDGRDELIIGNHVDIASEVMIYNSEHDISSEDFRASTDKVEISDYVFIGPRVIILPGVKIGRGAVVGAGAVVTKDVKEGSVVGGVPAHEIGERELKDFHYKLGRARLFQ